VPGLPVATKPSVPESDVSVIAARLVIVVRAKVNSSGRRIERDDRSIEFFWLAVNTDNLKSFPGFVFSGGGLRANLILLK